MSVKMAGQTINDRLLAARHSIAGQGLAKSVCKATTEEMIGPKKKHLDYLIHCTNEPNVSIPQLANLLIERSQNTNWVVVFKALITVHHMMCYGNERFTQYLASSNSTFQLSNFLDKSGVQGARVGYDMSPFIRRYAKYLNEKALSYRTVAFDFCKMKRGKEDGTLRTMNTEKLLKTLPVLQSQLDALLEFDCTANDLTNGVINMAFMLLFRDLIRLFACYNDGTINLLEKYFDMNKKQCRDALDLYKKFLIRMDRVAEFLKVAENVGIDKGDIPDLTKAPSSLLDALEQHLASLEGKKGSAANTPTQTASNRTNVKSAVSALSSTSSAFGTAAANARLDIHTNGIDESLKQQVLAEEEAAMNQYKAKVSSPTSAAAANTNPFLNSTAQQHPIVDLFGSPPASTESPAGKASADLLQLSANPFSDIFTSQGQPAAGTVPAPAGSDLWMSNGFQSAPPANNAFVSDQNFSSVFGATNSNASASSGMSAPNPFMSDFAPTTGNEAAEPPSSALFDGQTGSQAEGDLFGQAADLFGDVMGGGSEVLQPMEDGTGESKEREQGHAFSGLMQPLVADSSPSPVPGAGKASSPPPPRPPPPTMGIASSSMSPVPASGSPVHQSPAGGSSSKSAFDDLNDSIRAALGGSPTRPPASSAPLGLSMMGGFSSFDMQGPGPAGGGGAVFGQLGSTTSSYGSPGKQGLGMAAGAAGIQGSGGEPAANKVLTGDLDSSLASLAENLSINKGGQAAGKGVQWNSPKNVAKPGMTGWTPQPMAATTGAGYRPMGQGMAGMNSAPQYPPVAAMGMQPIPVMRQMGQAAPMMATPGMMGSPRMGAAPIMVPQQPSIVPQVAPQPVSGQPLDPFGAL